MQENLESQRYTEAQKKWDEKGHLGVTAADHEAIHSTPDEILVQNPGKTLGELMSDKEILEYIIGTQENIKSNEEIEKMKSYNEDLKKNLEVTTIYLKAIGRFPISLE